jgi:hypothetical protein
VSRLIEYCDGEAKAVVLEGMLHERDEEISKLKTVLAGLAHQPSLHPTLTRVSSKKFQKTPSHDKHPGNNKLHSPEFHPKSSKRPHRTTNTRATTR